MHKEAPPEPEEELLYCRVTTDWNRLPRETVVSLTGDTPEPPGSNPVPCPLG